VTASYACAAFFLGTIISTTFDCALSLVEVTACV